MQPHNPSHGAVLERILVGDLPRTTAEARAVLDRCQECRESLAELDTLQHQLTEAGSEERDGLAQAASADLDPQQERRIRDFVAARVQPKRKTSRPGRFLALALAASVCGVIAYGLLRPAPPTPAADVTLGGILTVPEGISPIGEVENFDDFKWRGPALVADETYTLRIRNLDAPDSEALVIDYIVEPRWLRDSAGVLASQRVEKFFSANPTKIEWQVEIHKGTQRDKRISRPEKAWLH